MNKLTQRHWCTCKCQLLGSWTSTMNMTSDFMFGQQKKSYNKGKHPSSKNVIPTNLPLKKVSAKISCSLSYRKYKQTRLIRQKHIMPCHLFMQSPSQAQLPDSEVGETTGPGTSRAPVILQPTKSKRQSRSSKFLQGIKSAFRSFPVLPPVCSFQSTVSGSSGLHDGHMPGAIRMTGTLYGPRKSRINLAIQENPRTLPSLVLEMGIHTGKLLQEIGCGLARIALECEKKAGKTNLLDEPLWNMYFNGRNIGYGAKKDLTETDLNVMQLLNSVSMGAGVLPVDFEEAAANGELTYMRAFFDRVICSKDSETFYMQNPDSNIGPDLSIFFIRI